MTLVTARRLIVALTILLTAVVASAAAAEARPAQDSDTRPTTSEDPVTPPTTSSTGDEGVSSSPGGPATQGQSTDMAWCPPASVGQYCSMRGSVLLGRYNVVFCYWANGVPACLPPGERNCTVIICEFEFSGRGEQVIPLSWSVTGNDPVITHIWIH
jgi:hypothetical protein